VDYGKACSAFVEETLSKPYGGYYGLKIHTYKNPDSFGRWLASVSIETGQFRHRDLVKEILIPEGWGVEWDGKGKNPTPWMEWDEYPNPGWGVVT